MESGVGLRRPARHQRGFDPFQVVSQTPDAWCLGHDGPRGHQPVRGSLRNDRGFGHVARHQQHRRGEFCASPRRPIPADSVRQTVGQ